MNKLTRTIVLSAALLLSALLAGSPTSSASPSPVRSGGPVLTGSGAWETPIGTVGFQVSLTEQGNGSLCGSGRSYLLGENGFSMFRFDVCDYLYVGNEILVLGLITDTFNTPPNIAVGSLTALVVQDNGSGNGVTDMAISASGLPPFLTIEDLAATLPPFRFSLGSGNFTAH